jgi:hypothetical protein
VNNAPLLLAGFGLVALVAVGVVAGASMVSRSDLLKLTAAYPQAGAPLITAVIRVANEVDTRPEWLAAVINWETGAKWRSDTKNPHSGATGLIQFLSSTAGKLGTSLASLAQLGEVDQMAWVRLYLDRVASGQWDDKQVGPLDTPQALAMAVFYPYARYWDADRAFPANVTKNNPGINTPGDYMRKLKKFSKAWT